MNEDIVAGHDAVARARALVDLRRYEQALELLALALARQPANDEALCLRTLCLLNLDRSEEALASAEHTISVIPDGEWALRLLAISRLHMFDVPAALDAARQAVAAAPWFAAPHTVYAEAELEAGNTDAADAAARQAIEAEPFSPLGYTVLAKILMRRHRWRDAEVQLRKALEVAPDDFEAMTYLGVTLRHRFRFLQALTIQSAAAQIDPAHQASLRNIVVTIWTMILVVALIALYPLRIGWGPITEWVSGLGPRGQYIVLTGGVLVAVGVVALIVRLIVLLPAPVKAVAAEFPGAVRSFGRELTRPAAGYELGRAIARGPEGRAALREERLRRRQKRKVWVPPALLHGVLGALFTLLLLIAIVAITTLGEPLEEGRTVGDVVGASVTLTILTVLVGSAFVIGGRRRVAAGHIPTRWGLVLRGIFSLTLTLLTLGSIADMTDPVSQAEDGLPSLTFLAAAMTLISFRAWLAFARAVGLRRRRTDEQEAPAV